MGIEQIAKTCRWLDSFTTDCWQQIPEKDGWQKRIIYSLFQWLENPENIMIEDFCYEHKIPVRTFRSWKTIYPQIGEAIIEAKIFIGARRRKGTMQFKYQYGSAYRDMHQYEPEWKEVDQYHAALSAEAINKANDAANNKNPITVVINRNSENE